MSLSAITREEANAIVRNYLKSEAVQTAAGALFANANDPDGEGISITTSNGENFRAKYACWAYCLNENEPKQRRYIFVKEENGSLLEVIASNDLGDEEPANSWADIDALTGLAENESNVKQLYPNPVGDLLTLPCNGEQTRVEIYDLKGTRIFLGQIAEDNYCQLNVSFLNAGVYTVNVSGKIVKIIKN